MTSENSFATPRIHVLPERLANQIAAGEVVERPASVLKELLENSLDAGARRITVDVESGGVRLIRVRDDGVGIRPEDLALALGRHATSKIGSLEDLENVASLGFRGEALPSIASVSRLELCSCAADGEGGWALVAESNAGQLSPRPHAHPPGTTVSVRDLFYNTPVRRKFLRTEKTEYRHLEDVLKRAALSRFDCAFSLRHNGREYFALAAARNDAERARRVARLCGSAFLESSLTVAGEATDLRLDGWIGAPGYSRGVADLQYLFVNGRMVRDQLLRHAVRQAYQGEVDSGRHPAYVLFLAVDPAQVDVNVHPGKHEVRFRDARSVHDFVVQCVRRALMHGVSDGGSPEAHGAPLPEFARPLTAAERTTATAAVREQAAAYPALRSGAGVAAAPGPLGEALEQIDRRYVVARNGQGLLVVDARRACRRIARAALERARAAGRITVRPLLVPVSITLEESRADRLERDLARLEELGFDLRRVAPDSIACRGVPAPLAGASPDALVSAVVQGLPGPGEGQWDDQEVSVLFEAALAGVDLTAGWSWDRDTMNDLLRELERLPDAGRGHDDAPTWRQLDGDHMAMLLTGR